VHCGIFVTAASRRSPGSVSVPMWPAVLSYRLPVFGLVGFYPANYLIGISLLPRRLAPLLSRDHEVLRTVSRAYPPPRGTFDTFTHPSATFPPCGVLVRLACFSHAASVQSEPESNSSLVVLCLCGLPRLAANMKVRPVFPGQPFLRSASEGSRPPHFHVGNTSDVIDWLSQ
jgi:hypothetical protein